MQVPTDLAKTGENDVNVALNNVFNYITENKVPPTTSASPEVPAVMQIRIAFLRILTIKKNRIWIWLLRIKWVLERFRILSILLKSVFDTYEHYYIFILLVRKYAKYSKIRIPMTEIWDRNAENMCEKTPFYLPRKTITLFT